VHGFDVTAITDPRCCSPTLRGAGGETWNPGGADGTPVVHSEFFSVALTEVEGSPPYVEGVSALQGAELGSARQPLRLRSGQARAAVPRGLSDMADTTHPTSAAAGRAAAVAASGRL
jgi:hypothetical protein